MIHTAPTPAPVCVCGHPATDHAVDDEERRECARCSCAAYYDAEAEHAETVATMRGYARSTGRS